MALVAWTRRVSPHVARIVIAGHLCAWSGGLLAVTITGDALSPTAFVWPALVTALVIQSATERPGA